MTAPGFLTETRERFLKAILAQLPVERIRELYLFQPMKQGGVESGVAVVAAWQEDAAREAEAAAAETSLIESDAAADGEAPVEEVDVAEVVGEAAEANACERPATEAAAEEEVSTPPAEKYTVYTARYRHVLKGPDRGKWEATVVAEADAPLVSIESVVRGVQRRAGDVDAPDHMTADDIRAALRLAPAAAGPA